MRICVTLEDSKGLESNVSQHFGQCSYFLIADIENGKIAENFVVENNASHGGGGCVAVDEAMKYNITHIISGGMGMGAQQKFAAAGVKIYGADTTASKAIEALIEDSLGDLEGCNEHKSCH